MSKLLPQYEPVCRPSIGAMFSIEKRGNMKIPSIIMLLNTKKPPKILYTLVASEALPRVEHRLEKYKTTLRNFLLEGIGYYEYSEKPLAFDDLKHLQSPDWLDMFKTYVGVMGHSAQEFWQLTLQEYLLAVEGFCLLHHIDPLSASAPATSNDLMELMETFPDH